MSGLLQTYATAKREEREQIEMEEWEMIEWERATDPYTDYHRELFGGEYAENPDWDPAYEQACNEAHEREMLMQEQYIEEALDWESFLLAAMLGGGFMGALLFGSGAVFVAAGIGGAVWLLGRGFKSLRG